MQLKKVSYEIDIQGSFYLKKGSEKKNGEVMIMARITIDGKLCQFSTKQSIQPDNWSITAGKAKGRDAGRINALLDDIRSSLNTIYHEMQRRDNYVTAEKVKNEFLGHSESHETILSLFQKHNDDVKQLVGISKTIATYRKYEVTRRHLAEFIQSKYNVSDISIKEISPMFITDFELSDSTEDDEDEETPPVEAVGKQIDSVSNAFRALNGDENTPFNEGRG